MKTSALARCWNEFFFTPQRPTSIALFRVLYGFLVVVNLLLLRSDWHTWYGVHGFTTAATARQIARERLDLLARCWNNDFSIEIFFWTFLLLGIFLTVGLFSRFSSIAVFLGLASLDHRNPTILHSGDALLRIIAFFLMFAPSGAALSVDRLLRVWRGVESSELRPCMPWAQRMIQLQVSLVYISTFWWKAMGSTWIAGTAVYYVLHLDEFRRFPVPDVQSLWVSRLMTWGTLAIEFGMGALVWFKELRYLVLAAGICLHLSIEYAMNIPLFQWIVLTTYVTFLSPADLSRAWASIRAYVAPLFGHPITVFCDETHPYGARLIHLLKAMDIFGRLSIIARSDCEDSLVVRDSGRRCTGWEAILRISQVIPLLWPLTPLRLLIGHSSRLLAQVPK